MTPLIARLARWARELPDETAYTFVDYATDPGGAHRAGRLG
ncbi:hypothetical protein [Actinomadura atramentaria]|nr:hypothetical protein [Actinomadura atramentaria]